MSGLGELELSQGGGLEETLASQTRWLGADGPGAPYPARGLDPTADGLECR